MRRLPNWLPMLTDAIATNADRPFAWGDWDCCQAAAEAVEAMTGGAVDLTAPFRYATRAGATRTLRGYLGERLPIVDLLPAVAVKRGLELGLPEVPRSRAQRGDVVLADAEVSWGAAAVLAVVDPTGVHAVTAARGGGWARLPPPAWRRAWRL